MNMRLEHMYNERVTNHFYFTFAVDTSDKNERPNLNFRQHGLGARNDRSAAHHS